MFGNKREIEMLRKENAGLKDLIKVYDKSVADMRIDFAKEKKMIEQDFASKERIYQAETATNIRKAVETKEDEINALKLNNAVLQKESEILEKAFENMGFDICDMKSILDKLVEGIIGKNKIQVIK